MFREVGPKSKSRRKVGRDIKKVEKHCSMTCFGLLPQVHTQQEQACFG